MQVLRKCWFQLGWYSEFSSPTAEYSYTFTSRQFPNPVILTYFQVSQNSVTIIDISYASSDLNSKLASCGGLWSNPRVHCKFRWLVLWQPSTPAGLCSVIFGTLRVLDSSPLKPCKTPPSGTSVFFKAVIPLVSFFGWVTSIAIVCAVLVYPTAIRRKWYHSSWYISSTCPRGSKAEHPSSVPPGSLISFCFICGSVVRSVPSSLPTTSPRELFWIWQPSKEELSPHKVNFCFSAGSHWFPLGLKVLLFG